MPPPSRVGGVSSRRRVLPLTGDRSSTSADLTWAPSRSGAARAAGRRAPATWGAAMLVPSKYCQRPSRLGTDERMPTPGALTSGFSPKEIGSRPPRRELRDHPALRRGGGGDGLRRRARRVDRAGTEHVEVVARRDDGTTPASAAASIACDDDVARRRHLRLAQREVDHIHPVPHRRARCPPRSRASCRRARNCGCRNRQHAVIPDVGVSGRSPESFRAPSGPVTVCHGPGGDAGDMCRRARTRWGRRAAWRSARSHREAGTPRATITLAVA